MRTKRGWTAKASRAPAAQSAFEMNQAKLSLSPTPVTRATLPLKSMGIMAGSLHELTGLLYTNRRGPGARVGARNWSRDREGAVGPLPRGRGSKESSDPTH